MDCMKDTLDTLRLNVSDVRARAHRTANQGMCSPYVTVKLVPGPSGAVALAKVRTATRSRTLFPLFDETFDLVVPESCGRDRTFLLFAVKDRGPLGDKILLGEAVLPLENIPLRLVSSVVAHLVAVATRSILGSNLTKYCAYLNVCAALQNHGRTYYCICLYFNSFVIPFDLNLSFLLYPDYTV